MSEALLDPPLTYEEVVEGVPARAVRELVRQGRLTEADVLAVVPKRTFERRVSMDQPLKVVEADAIARLIRVRDHARRAFDTAEQAELWLTEPNPELGGRSPIEMARTDLGAREAENVLTRFEHGVVG